MAAPQASSAVPPLPVLSHANDILGFLLSSLDDAAEDACKAVLLTAVFAAVGHAAVWLGISRCRRARVDAAAGDGAGGPGGDGGGGTGMRGRCRRLVCAGRRGRSLLGWLLLPSTQLALLAVLLAFPAVNQWSDAVGDSAQVVQNAVRVRLNYAPQAVRPKRPAPADVPFVATVVDDVVEDVFKAACVSAHVWFGMVLAAGVGGGLDGLLAAHGAQGAVAHGALVGAKLLVAVGTPAGEYGACDVYADALGDAAQRGMLRLLRPPPTRGSPHGSDHGGSEKRVRQHSVHHHGVGGDAGATPAEHAHMNGNEGGAVSGVDPQATYKDGARRQHQRVGSPDVADLYVYSNREHKADAGRGDRPRQRQRRKHHRRHTYGRENERDGD